MKCFRATTMVGLLGTFVLASCGIGGHYMEGISGKAREEYLKSIKPYIHYWRKPEMTNDVRLFDSADCGGGRREANNPSFSREQIQAAKRAGDLKEDDAYRHLFHDWERCMLDKGYRYTGKCLDNEISRAKPACGAP